MRVAREILTDLQHDIADLRLIPGSKGIFDVKVDDQLVFSKFKVHRHAQPGEIVPLIQAAMDASSTT